MSRSFDRDYLIEVQKGNISGASMVHKFGHNEDVGTSYEPLTTGGIYQTPQAASATTLRVKAGNVNDDAGGTGARLITLEGLDETGAYATEDIAPNGVAAGTASTTTFMRLFRAYVKESGTYATAVAGSHAADIVIENGAGGTDWLIIDSTNFPHSQSEIAVYSVPLGKTAYMLNFKLTTDANKAVDFLFFKRGSILDAAAPYDGMRLQFDMIGIQGHIIGELKGGLKFTELTDIGFMVQAASAAEASASFDILLIDD